MTFFSRLLRDTKAASAAEFALVLPLVLLFLFGIIDAGRFMWDYNRAEKATQMGVRYAVVTEPVMSGFKDYSFAIDGGVPAGDPVPNSADGGTEWFDSATCTEASCECTGGGGFCGAVGLDSTAFNNLVDRMRDFYPAIEPNNVQVDYRNVGVGFAGNPGGPDISPLVTVRFKADDPLVFHPVTCLIFACSFNMPDFRAALTLEDAAGNFSN